MSTEQHEDTGRVIPPWELTDRLRRARQHAGLNQQEIAVELGISKNTANNYESGRTVPSLAKLKAWALRCGVDEAWLITGQTTLAPSPGDGDGASGSSVRHEGFEPPTFCSVADQPARALRSVA